MASARCVGAAAVLACLAALSAQGTTILVNTGLYGSAAEAAASESHVNWRDDDPCDDTTCTETFAAIELQHYLRAGTGRRDDFTVADDEARPAGDWILVGGLKSNAASRELAAGFGLEEGALESLGPEGYVIRTRDINGRRVTLVAGGGRVGTLYGVYDLLHRLGVRWYAPGSLHEEVPRFAWERLPEVEARETPKILTRGFHAWEDRGDPEFLLWMARNRMNYWCVEQSEKALMRKLGIGMVGGSHELTPFYLGPSSEYPYNHPGFAGDEDKPADPYAPGPEPAVDANGDGKLSYFEAHPEWYALRDGKRSDRIVGDSGDNFCTSNADAMAEWTKNAVQDLIDGRYADAEFMNAWALDGGRWCECEACRALGTPTDRNLLLVYHYDRAIKAAQRDGRIHRPIRLLFLAYADVVEPPTRALPADFDYETCLATFFPIRRCYVHAFDEEACGPNAQYLRQLQGWATAPDRHYKGQIVIGEYYNVSGYKCLPIGFMHTMAKDIPLYYRLGARHFHYMHVTTKNWGNKALTNWQMARQLWDPETDCEALWTDYFAGRYGGAAQVMRGFYEELERMLCNASELKYGLARRLAGGAEDLFADDHLKYAEGGVGPSLTDMLESAEKCRARLDEAKAVEPPLPERVLRRIEEDEALFTYGERTLKFYDDLCRAYAAARAGRTAEARQALEMARERANLLEADTESTRHSSSHANAGNALEASFAAPALERIEKLLEEPRQSEKP